MGFALPRVVQLIGDRFLETAHAVFDVASGCEVRLRHLAACDSSDERRWTEACSRLAALWHEDMPALLDYGFTPHGRFEAYDGRCPDGGRWRDAAASAAVHAFIQGDEHSPSRRGASAPVRLGMRLTTPRAILRLAEILEDGRAGHPLSICCVAQPGAGGSTFLRIAAAEARRRGYIPVAAGALDRWPQVWPAIRHRSVLLLSDSEDSGGRAQRWFLSLGLSSPHAHVLLQMDRRACRSSDVLLQLEPIDSEVLAASVHVYPPGRWSVSRLRAVAAESGGSPGAFIQRLRERERPTRRVLRVAEARPAYLRRDEEPAGEVEHPWRDVIADAVRLADRGRRAAAERDLRQIAAAARRRQIPLAAAAAEIALGEMLLARGRIAAAGELFAASLAQCQGNGALATRAALGTGAVHLAQGELEAAESTFRVCRAGAPVQAAIGLAWTLCAQARFAEAERAVGPAREAGNVRERASAFTVLAVVALRGQDLPAAARAAGQALSLANADRATEALAAELLMAVHGRVGDRESVQRYGKRALSAARAAGSPLVALRVRATLVEALQGCGGIAARRDVERLVRLAERVPMLLRARLWAVARAHPVEDRRAEYLGRLQGFVQASGARGLLPLPAEPPGVALAAEVAALVAVHEGAPTPADAVRRLVEWARERVQARAAVICDADGAPLARAGGQETVAAAARVLMTRVAQPPWITSDGLESAVLIRYANRVHGVLACRWPLSRVVGPEVVPLLTAAASVAGPAVAALAERAASAPVALDGMIGRSGAIQRLRDLVCRAAAAPFSVLIEGESGAGKELVARAIHQASARRLRTCVAINCAALSDELFEAEVFGHARGAFTGAHAERAGLFEQADGGTLFLDEVSELSARAQAKLLRALQEGEVRRLGENHSRRVDVRVIAASNRRLEEDATAGRFRRDLLFRLAVVRIAVPPLRERREDIPLLAAHYWDAAARRARARSMLTASAVARLAQHDWPGNVRELQNVMAALAVQVPRGRVRAEHVDALIGPEDMPSRASESETGSLEQARRAFERQFIAAALARCGGRHGAAARELRISRQGLAKLLRRLAIS
jgi:DNA-binding NtrC family response regulator/Tfp pilus assembly protein PilF